MKLSSLVVTASGALLCSALHAGNAVSTAARPENALNPSLAVQVPPQKNVAPSRARKLQAAPVFRPAAFSAKPRVATKYQASMGAASTASAARVQQVSVSPRRNVSAGRR